MLISFEKLKELRSFLAYSIDDPTRFSKLMSSVSELKALLARINDDQVEIPNDGTFDRIFKITEVHEQMTKKYVQDIYDPLSNGLFQDIFDTRDKLVREGMEIQEANRLGEDY
jgi:hypothetical protein